ncbi:class I SAM-dependent methyltransferase [Sphingomonas sp. AR_OL41]|uniref:class I SAM-dependent methyltransferase n=1 Tax=Sphingomonas sp. AR_OL41 TaxID=3042729 RepID=UPI00248001A9|nr:class I SAM-dependent methyltransferase [Sphingomonas sp. AR_OL41]MDH7972745.1 class I SAM-dependent methyltransferase [Sphingomonas sp. AR_OL41]
MGLYSERIFPWFIERALDTPAIRAHRAKLIEGATGDVLEIGFGTGATLPYYDRATVRSLSVVEPSSGMNRRAQQRIDSLGWSIRIEALAGEALPFADESFDCVVVSLTMCTVADPPRVLAEIRRVLRPGGSLRFFEHVASADPARRKWQDRLNPVQRVVGVGCNLNRDTVAYIRAAGFELGPVAQQIEPAFPFADYMPIVEGVARKPAPDAAGQGNAPRQ